LRENKERPQDSVEQAPTAVEPVHPLLEVDGVSKHYTLRRNWLGRPEVVLQAVDRVSLKLMQGETLGVIGESGCGKSTLGKMLVRIEEPTAGDIRYQGKSILGLSGQELKRYRSEVQFIFQDPYASLNPRQKVFDILAEPMKVHGLYEGERLNRRVYELLDMVGIPGAYSERYPHEFSGGQRQRIGIARALSLNTKIIVCDEPVSALDVSIQAQILNLLRELQQSLGLSYLFIAHGLGVVKYISRRIAVMYLGKIVEIAGAEELFRQPRHPYTKALIDAHLTVNPRERGRRMLLAGEVPNAINPPRGCRFHPRCPFATDVCREQEPGLEGDGGHRFACHHPLAAAKGASAP